MASKYQPLVPNSLLSRKRFLIGLRYKLRMFGIPIEGESNVFCNNEAVYKNASTPESTLSKKQHSIAYIIIVKKTLLLRFVDW